MESRDTVIIENKRIPALSVKELGKDVDALGLCDGRHYEIRNCIIDTTHIPKNKMDEAVGITHGSSATFSDCVIRGAAKLVLCGCGDRKSKDPEIQAKVAAEAGKKVIFHHCLLEDFGRRGVECQDGMIVELHNCVIRNWGIPSRWSVRAFASWAHHGGTIIAKDCVFYQDDAWHGWLYFFRDLFAHVGQNVRDEGLRGLFSTNAWTPGHLRALTESAGGTAISEFCCVDSNVRLDGTNMVPMNKGDAVDLVADIEAMYEALKLRVGE